MVEISPNLSCPGCVDSGIGVKLKDLRSLSERSLQRPSVTSYGGRMTSSPLWGVQCALTALGL